MRPGFTLVEIVVALVLFQLAMLALTATTIAVARDLADAERRTRAVQLAEHRVALLRASACSAPTSGSADHGGIRERWRVSGAGRFRLVTDSVEVRHARTTRHFVAQGWVPCP